MKLLIIRHGRAEERMDFALSGEADGFRPLTDDGRKRLRRALPGLTALVPKLDLLASSPLTRAVQTADEIAAGYPGVARSETRRLAPAATVEHVAEWLLRHEKQAVVAIVGHEPDLGLLASWLLAGSNYSFVPLKKGGACLLEIGGEIGPASATLEWLMSPGQLRKIKGKDV